MRLLHLHDAPHVSGGATAYLRRLVEDAAGRGHEQWGWSLDERISHPALAGAEDFRYPWPAGALRRRLDFDGNHKPLRVHLHDWIRATQPDLIHVQNCAAFRNTVFPALRRCGVPAIMTVHDFSLTRGAPSSRPRSGFRGLIQGALDAASLWRARRAAERAVRLFLCPTRALQESLCFDPSRTRLQRLPIELREAAPWPDLVFNKSLALFFAGSLYRSKGVDLLLQAMTLGREAIAGATLEIAGTGDQSADLKALTRRLGLSSRVRFLGHCGPEAMEAAYGRAHLLVLPSRVPENSPLTVLEAGARGRPAIASGRGGVPELLGVDRGWTFRNEDAADLARVLELAASDFSELRARGERMRSWVRREFDPQRHWDELERVRQEIAGSGAAP